MTAELRIYTVKPGRMQDWLREWKAGVRPLREKLGFQVVGPWLIEDENKFIWILQYAGPGTYEAANASYYDSAERRALQPDPARHLASTETRAITTVG